ncbi:MAG: thioesterase family protein [Pseudomonadales bacterium]|nr:thioesterase family protein [Pseudomonadales bacterium]
MITAPFIALKTTVPKTWIDINGHMNATHYGLVVYDAHVNFTETIGLGESYVNASQCGKAVLESHMIYEREVSLADELEVRSWLLAVDKKRLHFFHEVYNISQGFRAAAAEQVDIHIDLNKRQSTALPEDLYQSLQERVKANLALALPDKIGSQIRAPKNIWLIK